MIMNWEKISLNELGTFKNGVNFKSSDMGTGIPLINVKDITNSHLFKLDNLDRVKIDIADDYIADYDDLFFVRSSVKLSGIGLVGKFRDELISENAVHCGFVIRFRPNKEFIYSDFLMYLLLTPYYRQRIQNLSGGAAIVIEVTH